MNKINQSILSLQHNQKSSVLGNNLKSLWLSMPSYCHLKCPYCFASANEPGKIINGMDKPTYSKIISEFADLGGEFIGIPGDGEPFHHSNWDLTQHIATLCHNKNIKLALFTTGDSIFFDPNGQVEHPDYNKADFLEDKDVVFLIKYNHSQEEVQNILVGGHNPNYTKLRERSIEILIEKYKFNDKRKRIGLVTSIINENSSKKEKNGELEIVNIFRRTQKENLIFDCDTILELGRGKTFSKNNKNVPPKVDLEKVFIKLKDAGAVGLNQGGTYVGNTCCDRILHHLYIKANGNVFPCIGCSRDVLDQKMLLGNVKEESLEKIWHTDLRQRLKQDYKKILVGTCPKCENFQSDACFSCLGRCIESDLKAFTSGESGQIEEIQTIGCIHHIPNTFIWLSETNKYIRAFLSYPQTKNILKEKGLEFLWRPNKNIAFTLWQLNSENRQKELENIINHKSNPQDDWSYRPYTAINDSAIEHFSHKKHYKFSELKFPKNTIWDFIRDPFLFDELVSKDKRQKEQLLRVISQSFLSNIFIPSFKILFHKHDANGNNLMFSNFILYDNIKDQYFYRSIISNPINKPVLKPQYFKSLIISRWYESITHGGELRNFWNEQCFNLSAQFRHEIFGDYQLKIGGHSNTYNSERTIDLVHIISLPQIAKKVNDFDQYLTNFNLDDLLVKHGISSTGLNCDFLLNTEIFSELEESNKNEKRKIDAIVSLYHNINEVTFFPLDDPVNSSLLDNLETLLDNTSPGIGSTNMQLRNSNIVTNKLYDILRKSRLEGQGSKVLNYFVFLGIMNQCLGINYYYLLHSTNFANIDTNKAILTAENDLHGVIKASGILLGTKETISQSFQSELNIFMSSILAPFDEFYFKNNLDKTFRENRKAKIELGFNEKVKSHRHSIFNLRVGYVNAMEKLSEAIIKCSDTSCDHKELIQNRVNNLKTVYEIYNIAVISGITDKSEFPSYFGKTIPDIIRRICDYCTITYTFLKLEQSVNSFNVLTDKPIEAFTILFNLIVNAAKSRSYNGYNQEYNYYTISGSFTKEKYVIEISNPAKIDRRCQDFINADFIDYDSFEFDDLIKEWGGLTIAKKLSKRLGWDLKINTKGVWTVTKISINIHP
jgi:radical SAM protein with 4Fe4S-binding SPASM domain